MRVSTIDALGTSTHSSLFLILSTQQGSHALLFDLLLPSPPLILLLLLLLFFFLCVCVYLFVCFLNVVVLDNAM